jgi:drug/metabolite transporter (DMT)-like permease
MQANSAQNLFPVLTLLLAATMWGLIWYPLRAMESAGLHGLWSTLISYGGALAVSLWVPFRFRREFARRPLTLLLLALASGWCNVAFIMAVLEGTVVRALLLFYLSPLWTVLLGRLLLGERLDRRASIVLLLALGGAVVMLWDPVIDRPWPRSGADWLAVSSGVGFALSNVLVRKLQDIPIAVKSVCNWLGVVLVALVWVALAGIAAPAVTPGVYAGALALGLFGFVVMTVAVQYGVTRMPVYRSAVILLFEIVVGAVSSMLLTHESVYPWEWLGGMLIVTAACCNCITPAS